MIQRNSCPNYNHSRFNAPVRACPMCGEVVNGAITIKNCNEEEHAKKLKDRDRYCIDCGKQLIQGM